MKIAIDFDGVICERTGIPREDDYADEEPVEDAWKAINWLKHKHDIYILTSRTEGEFRTIRNWLAKNEFPVLMVTNIKQKGTEMIIDDRAIRFTNWLDICKYLG